MRTSEKANVRSIAHAPSPAGYADAHARMLMRHVVLTQAFFLSVSPLSLLILFSLFPMDKKLRKVYPQCAVRGCGHESAV